MLYASAGEAVLYREVERDPGRALVERAVEAARSPAGSSRALPPADPEANRVRAGRRAKGRVRRYVVANGCTRLVTLTCRDQTADRGVLLARLQTFTRLLNRVVPGVAWAWVIERHKSGALHAHLGLAEYVHYRRLRRLWPHGHVWANLMRRGHGRPSAKRAAAYLAKYVSKDPVASAGEHRYEVRQGFQPESARATAATFDEAWRLAVAMMGGEVPSYEWESGSCEDWTGPPVRFLGW